MRSLVEQHIESEASAPAEADLSPSKSAASQEALLDGGSSFEMLLTMAEADLTEEKKALQRRARALLQAVEQGGGETSPTAGGGGAAAAACAAALPGRPPRGPPEGSSASSSSAAPALFGLGLPEGPLASAKTLASAAKGAAGRLAGALEAKQLRRLRQLDTIASRLHDELKVRRGGSSLYSPRSSSLASAPARGARAPASLGAASAAGSASASGVSSSALSGVSKARSELRGRQLDGQIKAMSRRFLLRRDMR